MFDTSLKKKRAAGFFLLAILLTLFLLFNRIPKLDTVQGDLAAATSPQVECFQGFCTEPSPDSTLLSRWWSFSLTYLRLVALGMTFAFLVAGLVEAFFFPRSSGPGFSGRGIKGALQGLLVGPAMNLCSACIVPVSSAFRRRGASIEATLAIVQGSSTLNLPSLIMAVMVFAPMIGGARILLSLVGALMIGPLVAIAVGQRGQAFLGVHLETEPMDGETSSWKEALMEGAGDWMRSSVGFLIRLGPIMVLVGFASGLAIQWISPQTVATFLGNNVSGIAIAATLGVLINVPLLFEIPLVAALLMLGMGTAPAATLLFVAAAGGPITFWGLAKVMPKRAIAAFATSTWTLGLVGGLIILSLGLLTEGDEIGLRARVVSANVEEKASTTPGRADPALSDAGDSGSSNNVRRTMISSVLEELPSRVLTSNASEPATALEVIPFTNVASKTGVLDQGHQVWNDRPGVVVFDYDRDGDLDFYLTAAVGSPNWLYRNGGDGTFTDAAQEAGVAATDSNSTGVVACDIDNDGYQDLYVGAWGLRADSLGFRSETEGNRDRLFLNNGDGTFRDITESAFGAGANLRSAVSIACADVNGDGWVDIYVGNLLDDDFRRFDQPSHPGHYNVLYKNNGDLTFTEISERAGVRGPQILMRDPDGQPVLFEDPETGEKYEGYDPKRKDKMGNRVGEPTGQTHAVLFFDYDDDGDPDLWVANDGDRLHLFRNDSTSGHIRFTPVGRAIGIDKQGAWMGFALGDYDGDSDLDVFVTNIGFHPLILPPVKTPRAACDYNMRFTWGTCAHFLLRNDGVKEVAGVGIVGDFKDVAPSTFVIPSPLMPPQSLDPSSIDPSNQVPTGLAAYDFGFGATFFDYDNDGDQDLYWLGSTVARGEAPGGQTFPSAGRMLRGDGLGSFEDITVRAHLLDVEGVNYLNSHRISPKYHENGKGVTHGDLNGDGYVDLIGTNSSGPRFVEPRILNFTELTPGPVFVWLNGGGVNHWITLRLRGRMAIDGTGSNADGIGARVYVKTTPDGKTGPRIQVQEVIAGSSYLSMDSIDLEFGVEVATIVDEIVILWPSGRIQTLENVPVDQVTTVTEPAM